MTKRLDEKQVSKTVNEKKHKHSWAKIPNELKIKCVCGRIEDIDNELHVLSFGGGIDTCYMLFKYDYDIIVHSDIANGDREHGEYDITYWILDNIVKPYCEKKGIALWITTHPKGGVFERAINEKKLPVISRRWCTQDHKIDLNTQAIRKGLDANFPDNVIVSDIGFSYDEYWRSDGKGSKVKYNPLDYPLVNDKITRQDCINWLNENHPIIMNDNKIDWKDAKSGCWFCPNWNVSKLKELSRERKEELVKMEENSAHNLTFKKKPMKIVLGLDSHSLMEWSEEDEEQDTQRCNSGVCFT